MLNPVPMVRLRAMFLERDGREALQALGELGLLHLIRGRAGPDTAPLAPPPVGTAWDNLLERLERLQTALGIPTSEGTSETPPKVAPEAVEQSLREMEERARQLLGRREERLRSRDELSDLAGRLENYLGLGISLDRVGRGAFLHLLLGTLPDGRLEEFQKCLGERALLLALPSREGRQPLVVVGTREGDGSAFEGVLRDAGFRWEPLPMGGTLDAFAKEIGQETHRAVEEVACLDAEICSFSEEIARPLANLERHIRLERSLLEAEGQCPRTNAALLLQGWMPAVDAPLLEGRLREATGENCVLETSLPEKAEEDQVPVLLRPSPMLRPFGNLVAGYGLPTYLEISPTPFVALSYLLMFGMMFGDLGHGAILAMAGLTALHLGKRDAGFLLLSGGISSALFGAVYGSCFGLARFKPFALWQDPLEANPVHLMSLAIGLGVLMISLGLALNILNRFRRHDVLGALMGRFGLAGLLFYWGALGILLWQGSPPRLLPALLVLPLAAWVLHGPLQEALRRRAGHAPEPGGTGLPAALVEAFETLLVYLANTISFVRLAAYAMSHAALLAATFMLAAAVARPDGGSGPLSWLVVVAGNLVAILLEGLIASIQALRLEYYEFFGKFFSGAGRPFEPFRLNWDGGEA